VNAVVKVFYFLSSTLYQKLRAGEIAPWVQSSAQQKKKKKVTGKYLTVCVRGEI
jgi:hypothetical protein